MSANKKPNYYLTIPNNNIIQYTTLPNPLYTTLPTGITTGTTGTSDRFYIFTHTGGFDTNTTYNNVPIPDGITFDLFMIGGGGAGGGIGGAEGGSGACLVAFSQTITSGNYNFVVAGGGSVNGTGTERFGYNTYINIPSALNLYLARGGGGGVADSVHGNVGGCSGAAGGGIDNVVYTSPAPDTDNYFNGTSSAPVVNNTIQYGIYGNKGGNIADTGSDGYNTINYGGDGGIGVASANSTTTTKATTCGDGLYQVVISSTTYNLRTYFTNNGTFGVQDGTTGNYYIGGGGVAGGYNPSIAPTNISGGRGGGGIGKNGNSPANGTVGQPNTGSGGGTGSTGAGGVSYGTYGGSGLLIFRYRRTNTITNVNSIIELIRGTTIDSKTDYRLGNYDGSFKVKLEVNNYEVDVLSVGETFGIVSAPFGITTPLNVGVSTLNNINPSDWLRKSECVLYLAATTRTQSGLWTSVFHIAANTIRSFYNPDVNWRLRIAFSTDDNLSTFVYGFFWAVYDKVANTFVSYIED